MKLSSVDPFVHSRRFVVECANNDGRWNTAHTESQQSQSHSSSAQGQCQAPGCWSCCSQGWAGSFSPCETCSCLLHGHSPIQLCATQNRTRASSSLPSALMGFLGEPPRAEPPWLCHQQVKIPLICLIPLCFQHLGTKSQQKSSCWQSPCRLLWAPQLFLDITADVVQWSSGKLAGVPFRWLF